MADGTARVVQEYAGGRLAVLGLPLPAVVGVQSASSPPRYVSMGRLRQAMTEATRRDARRSASRRRPRRRRSSRSPGRSRRRSATMLDGDAEEMAAQIVAVLRERGALVS